MEGCEKEEEEMQADAWQHDYLMAKGLSCSNSAMCRPWITYICMYVLCMHAVRDYRGTSSPPFHAPVTQFFFFDGRDLIALTGEENI